MKRNEIVIADKIYLKQNKKSNSNYFKDAIKVNIIDKNFTAHDGELNACFVSLSLYEQIGIKAILINKDSSQYQEMNIYPKKELVDNNIQISSSINNGISYDSGDDIYLLPLSSYIFNSFKTQKFENIKEDIIEISNKDYLDNNIDLAQYSSSLFSFTNNVTGESYIIKKSHIKIDKDLTKGVMRLNKKQRIYLGLEINESIGDRTYNYLIDKINNNKDQLAILNKAYDEKHHLRKDASFIDKNNAQKLINELLKFSIVITPVIESFNKKKSFNIITKLADFYVGKSTLSLMGKRPYQIDEGNDVVRLSKTNMALLGVDEMDQILVTYKYKTVKCKVIELKNEDSFKDANMPINVDLVIGLPANIRNRLNLKNISSSIKVDRDTKFIFKKSINEQLIPILLTFVSGLVVSGFEILKGTIISLILIPFVCFFNLSNKRNNRLK